MRVRLSAAPTAPSLGESLGAGGPKGSWTESGGTDEVGRGTVRPPCLRARTPSDTRLRQVARASCRTRAGPETSDMSSRTCPYGHVLTACPPRTCPREHVLRACPANMSCEHVPGHVPPDMSPRTCPASHVSRTPGQVAASCSPGHTRATHARPEGRRGPAFGYADRTVLQRKPGCRGAEGVLDRVRRDR